MPDRMKQSTRSLLLPALASVLALASCGPVEDSAVTDVAVSSAPARPQGPAARTTPDGPDAAVLASVPMPEGAAGAALRRFMLVSALPSELATPDILNAALLDLRQHAEAAVGALSHAYAALPADRHALRWAVVSTMAALEHPAAIRPLREIAASPVRRSTPGGMDAAREEELLMRVRAVVGLTEIARRGERPAAAALRNLLHHDESIVRETAVRGYLRLGGDRGARAQELRTILGVGDLWMLSLREAAHPSEVAQPTPPTGPGRKGARAVPSPRR